MESRAGATPSFSIDAIAGRRSCSDSELERAIVSLREKDLAAAYDPSQVAALAALVDAKNVVDKKLEEIQKKMEEQQRDTARNQQCSTRPAVRKANATSLNFGGWNRGK